MRRYCGFDTDNARWDHVELRAGDIVVSSPMKAGTTWTQWICLLLVHGTPELSAPLATLSPWIDMRTRPIEDVVAGLDAQPHRRVMKTHTPLDGLPRRDDVAYLGVGRHPLDLVLSAVDHSANVDRVTTFRLVAATVGDDEARARWADRPARPGDGRDRLDAFLVESHPPETALTLAGVLDHYRSYVRCRPPADRVHYRDLTSDLDGEMRRLALVLGVDDPGARWPELVAAATLPAMRQRAGDLSPSGDLGLLRSADRFFARGRLDEWRTVVPPDARARFRHRIEELDPHDEVSTWAQWGRQGPIGEGL